MSGKTDHLAMISRYWYNIIACVSLYANGEVLFVIAYMTVPELSVCRYEYPRNYIFSRNGSLLIKL